MKFIRDLSIKNKLIIIILTIVLSSIIILFATFITRDIKFFKNEMVSLSRMTAKIVGVDCVPPLTFNDVKGGTGILQKLRDLQSVDYACIYNNNHRIFASFGTMADTNKYNYLISSPSAIFEGDYLYVLEPIEYDGNKYGDIFLILTTRQLYKRIEDHIFVMSLIAVVVIILAYILALWLQKLISKPILSLAKVTEDISKSADYSQKVKRQTNDEIGILYDSFNNMLEQIHLREEERNKAEKALYKSEAKYRNYIDSAPHGVFISNAKGEYIEVNDAACLMTGYTKEELLQKTVSTITGPNSMTETLIVFAELKKKGSAVLEAEFINKEGKIRYWEITATKLSEDRYLGFTVDITKRRKADEALKRSENTLSKAQEIAHIGSWEWDLMTNNIKWSDEMYNIFNYDPDTGISFKVLRKKIHPDDQNIIIDALKKIRSGIVIPILEFKMMPFDKEIKYITVMAESILDDNGKVQLITGTAQDVTERKESEERIRNQNVLLEKAVIKKTLEMENMMEKMIQQEKLVTIGKVSGSIAHEIRNPLGAVKQAVFYLKSKLTDHPPKIKKHLQLMDEELTITNRVISNLLEMTQLGEASKEKVSIDELSKQAVNSIKFGDQIKYSFNISKKAEYMWADPLQMHQVFVKLINNAAQAMDKKGEIEFKSQIKNNSVVIEITDNGPGMKKDSVNRAFEPLFTTKAKGTGLGLSICKQIIDNHGGEIKISSAINRGTTVSLILPSQSNCN